MFSHTQVCLGDCQLSFDMKLRIFAHMLKDLENMFEMALLRVGIAT